MSVNKVTLLGHTGKAPDFKEFDNGGCVATFSLATTKRGFTAKDGRQIPERTEWHNIVLQNGLAKVANQYVKKGDKLYIEGELRTRSYDDAQGVKRYITEIVATDMEMLTPKGTGAGTQAPPPPVPDAPAPTEPTIYRFNLFEYGSDKRTGYLQPKGKSRGICRERRQLLRWLFQRMHVLLFAQRAGRKSVGRPIPRN